MATLMSMSTAEGWDLTVPATDDELLDELRRHGVRAGQRLHVVTAALDVDAAPDRVEQVPRFRFAGIIKDGPADVASTVNERLAEGFGRS